MRSIKSQNILPLARKDVERIKKEAKIVWQIDENGKIVNSYVNNSGRIWSLAVIGPVSQDSINGEIKKILQKIGLLEEAISEKELLLLEIGFRRGKPYRAGFDSKTMEFILRRRKWFFLSNRQYAEIAPILFEIINSATNFRRKECVPFLPSAGKAKSFRRNGGLTFLFPGVRFSASIEDVNVFSDILWAEKNLNFVHQKFVLWLAKTLERGIKFRSALRKDLYIEKLIRNPKLRLSVLLRVADAIIDKSVKVNILQFINNRFEEKEEAEAEYEKGIVDSVLPNPEKRLGTIQLRIERIKRNCVVFEVYPNGLSCWYT